MAQSLGSTLHRRNASLISLLGTPEACNTERRQRRARERRDIQDPRAGTLAQRPRPLRRDRDMDARGLLPRLQQPLRLQLLHPHPGRGTAGSYRHGRRYYRPRRKLTKIEPAGSVSEDDDDEEWVS